MSPMQDLFTDDDDPFADPPPALEVGVPCLIHTPIQYTRTITENGTKIEIQGQRWVWRRGEFLRASPKMSAPDLAFARVRGQEVPVSRFDVLLDLAPPTTMTIVLSCRLNPHHARRVGPARCEECITASVWGVEGPPKTPIVEE